MKEYEHDKATVNTWLNNGGAEIVIDVLRRMGWKIDVLQGCEWQWVDDVVVVANRENNTMYINGAKSPWQQAIFAALVDGRNRPVREDPLDFDKMRREFLFPILSDGDKFHEPSIYLCYSFIDRIRIASEVTAALIGASIPVGA